MNAKAYIKRVDQKVDKLRGYLLGMDIPFQQFLPECGIGMEKKDQIRWLTDRVSFILVSVVPWTSVKEVEFTWRWLYGMIRYIYEACPQSDWNFYSVSRLSKMDQGFRETFFWRNEDYLVPLRSPQKPELLDSLETAVVELAGESLLRARIDTMLWDKNKERK